MIKKYQNKEDLFNNLITKENTLLDVGFWGQGVSLADANWPHSLIKERAKVIIASKK